jgi:hypothetical protein
MADVPSKESLTEDDASMSDVEPGKPPLDVQEGERVKSDDPLGQLSVLEDESSEANDENGMDMSRPSDVRMVDGGPLSESKGAQPHLSNSEEGSDQEDRHANALESFDSSVNGKIAFPTVRITEPMPQINLPNQISADFESAVRLAAEFEPRRSSRNVPGKNQPTVNYADYVPARKSFNSKKKLAFENQEVMLQASLPFLPSNWGNKFALGGNRGQKTESLQRGEGYG